MKKIFSIILVSIAFFANAKNPNEILESQLSSGTTINIRSFGNTNFFYRRCFAEITNQYCKINGFVFSRNYLLHRMRVVQHIGYCEYIVDVDEWEPDIPSEYNNHSHGEWKNIGWNKITLTKTGDNLADDEVGTCYGWPSDEVYEYTTVMGATKRIKVFHTIKDKDIESLTFEDVINHLKEGKTFVINFKHLAFFPNGAKCYPTAWRVHIAKDKGKIVRFGK